MRLLFAHALIVLFTVVVGVATLPSLKSLPSDDSKSSKRGLTGPDQGPYFQVTQASLDVRAGRYMLDSNFRGEFYNFKSVKIPSSEYELRELESVGSVSKTGAWSLRSLIIENESVAFQTKTYEGESFSFTGSFRPNSRCSASIVTSGMDGQLTKFHDGVLVATIQASFDLICGC